MVARGERDKQSTGEAQGSETILYDTTAVDAFHYPFAQIHRMHNKNKL